MRKISERIVLDLDGTLVENLPYEVYEKDDHERMRLVELRPHVIAYAQRLQQMGAKLAIATGRNIKFKALTIETVARFELGPLPIYMRRSELFDLAMAAKEKAEAILEFGATLIIGDRDDLDGEAARIAGVRFMHVEEIK